MRTTREDRDDEMKIKITFLANIRTYYYEHMHTSRLLCRTTCRKAKKKEKWGGCAIFVFLFSSFLQTNHRGGKQQKKQNERIYSSHHKPQGPLETRRASSPSPSEKLPPAGRREKRSQQKQQKRSTARSIDPSKRTKQDKTKNEMKQNQTKRNRTKKNSAPGRRTYKNITLHINS